VRLLRSVNSLTAPSRNILTYLLIYLLTYLHPHTYTHIVTKWSLYPCRTYYVVGTDKNSYLLQQKTQSSSL